MNSNEKEQPKQNQSYLDLYNLPFMPDIDDIIYFDGLESIKVERWRVEFFYDVISERLQQEMEYIDLEHTPLALFKVMLNIIHTPSFWTFFTEAEQQEIEREMICPFPATCCQKTDEEFPFVPSFLIFERKKDEQTIRFRRYPITNANPPLKVLTEVLEMLQKREELDGKIFARKMEQVPDKDEYIVNRTLSEAREAINRLRDLGVDEFSIRQLLVCDEQPYELHILNNGRFYAIPRYKNMEEDTQPTEIRLSPLEKAVYLLFLHHPEGIMFSYLPDHREELMRYYRQLMNYRTTQQMLKSIEDVTDPTLNSINEKCARIRRIFIDAIGERNADNYCVTGTRNSPKSVRLDRSLVHCQIV